LTHLVCIIYAFNDVFDWLLNFRSKKLSHIHLKESLFFCTYFQNFTISRDRIKTVPAKEIYTQRTINKLMKHESVIVAESGVLHNFMNLYYQYHLIETGDREDFRMAGFVIRKSLNSTIKNILNKVWVKNILLNEINIIFILPVKIQNYKSLWDSKT
jgi:hypothetical protein